MNLNVPMLVRTLQTVRSDGSVFVRFDDLAKYYRVWGINLSFKEGADFNYDPTDDPAEVDELRQLYQPSLAGVAAPALMIVAATCSEGAHINGILLDTQRRGISAIFTSSDRYSAGDSETRFEVVAHEIGHLFNLVHGFADAPYPTAMNQYDQRANVDRRVVWQRHIDATPASERAAMAGFFNGGAHSPIGLPFSPRCQQHISHSSSSSVLPWGGAFADVGTETGDSDNPLNCMLSIRRAEIEVGHPIDLVISVATNLDAEPIPIPKGLGLSEGTMELYIHGERGSRKYFPRRLICAEGTRLLTSRENVHRSYSLLGDTNGLLFPSPGAYKVEARLPGFSARSALVEVRVEVPTEEFAMPKLLAFLAAGMPNGDTSGWMLLARAARNVKINRAVRAHLTHAALSRRPKDAGVVPGVVALAKFESPRTFQRDVLLSLSRKSRVAAGLGTDDAALLDEAESALRADDDHHPSLEFVEKLRNTTMGKRK